jgi:hypothetical protein
MMKTVIAAKESVSHRIPKKAAKTVKTRERMIKGKPS